MQMNKHSILIVDDEPGLLESLSILLEKDFNILTASNGKEGLSIFKNNPSISLILLDLDMPVMNGVETLERIRAVNSKVKVLIMTGRSCHEYASRCADLNVHGYMKKPVEPGNLINRLKELLSIEDYQILREILGKEYEEKIVSLSLVVRNALNYIEKNYQKTFSREDMAGHLDISPEHLSRSFHDQCGITLRDYIVSVRLQRSKELLSKESHLKIRKIANLVGLSDGDYFCKIFKNQTGLTPLEYRKNSLRSFTS